MNSMPMRQCGQRRTNVVSLGVHSTPMHGSRSTWNSKANPLNITSDESPLRRYSRSCRHFGSLPTKSAETR